MYPVGISNLDRCLQSANNIKEDSSMGKEQRGMCYRRYVRNRRDNQNESTISNISHSILANG